MHLLMLIFGIVLLPKACTLKCYECIPGIFGTCTTVEKECPGGQRCSAIRVSVYAGGPKPTDVNMKGCALTEECGEASVNFGFGETIINSKCCATELCNSQPAPEPSRSSPNGKKCFYCDEKTCDATVNCEGKEDYCVSTTVTAHEKVTAKGCASKLMCSKQSSQIPGVGRVELSCCQGDYCNSASSTSAGLLLLVAPLVSLVVLS